MSVLAELVGDMERRIRLHSESLVEELALRDELDFAKEQRNQFIWLLLRVQKRRHQLLHRQQLQHDDSCQPNAGVSDLTCEIIFLRLSKTVHLSNITASVYYNDDDYASAVLYSALF